MEKKILYLDSLNEKWKQEDTYKKLQSDFLKVLDQWINDGIEPVQYLKGGVWKLDETVFFNTRQDMAILLILNRNFEEGVYNDHAKMIFAKQKLGEWEYYFNSIPTLGADRVGRKEDKNVPFTFEELSNMGKARIVESGYIKNNSCQINDKYIAGWADQDLEKSKKRFLNRKVRN